MADILINGTFKNNTKSGTIAYASQIKAGSQMQSELNNTFATQIADLYNSGGSSGSGGFADITDLENRVTVLESESGIGASYKNYIEGAYFKSGSIEGVVFNKDYAYCSEYIPVTAGATYTFNLGKAGTLGKVSANIAAYNSSKSRVTSYSCNADSRNIKVHSQAAYVRISFPLGHTDEVSISDSSGNILWQSKIVALSTVELLNKDRLTLRNIYNATSDLRLFFFSDIHGDNLAFQRIIEMANGWKNADLIDAVLNGGDTTEEYTTTTGVNWYNALVPTLDAPLLMVLGNHDTKMGLSAVDAYNTVMSTSMAKLSSLIGNKLSQPLDAATNGKSYYYVDFDSHKSGSVEKIRVIALDCMNTDSYWDSDEQQWLSNALSDANSNGYYVIILTHASPQSNYTLIESNFTSSNITYNTGTWSLKQEAITEVSSFISNGGKFICWLCGHTHADYLLYPKNGGTIYSEQVMFVTSCASCSKGYTAPYRTYDKNDVFRDTFNYITVDLANNILRIIRIGKNYDGRLVSKTGMEYNFSTHQVTKQW